MTHKLPIKEGLDIMKAMIVHDHYLAIHPEHEEYFEKVKFLTNGLIKNFTRKLEKFLTSSWKIFSNGKDKNDKIYNIYYETQKEETNLPDIPHYSLSWKTKNLIPIKGITDTHYSVFFGFLNNGIETPITFSVEYIKIICSINSVFTDIPFDGGKFNFRELKNYVYEKIEKYNLMKYFLYFQTNMKWIITDKCLIA